MRRILLCEFVNGETRPSNEALAGLIIGGISADHMLERWDPRTGANTMPTEWKRRAQKRAKWASEAIGTNIANVTIAFMAMRDWGARIDYDEAAGTTWAILDNEATP